MVKIDFNMDAAVRDPLFDHYPEWTIQRFLKFHNENPHVFDELETLVFQARSTGRAKYSIRTIYEVLRWNRDLQTTGEEFKLNDKYHSLYARAIVVKYPELKPFFELRSPRAADRLKESA